MYRDPEPGGKKTQDAELPLFDQPAPHGSVSEKFAPRMRHSQNLAQGHGTANTAGTGPEANEGPSQKQTHVEQAALPEIEKVPETSRALTGRCDLSGAKNSAGIPNGGSNDAKCQKHIAAQSQGEQAHARRSDPVTSHQAAAKIANLGRTREAIKKILSLYGPSTDERIRVIYAGLTESGEDLPFSSPSGLRSRRSELVKLKLVEDSGERGKTELGNDAIKWRLK